MLNGDLKSAFGLISHKTHCLEVYVRLFGAIEASCNLCKIPQLFEKISTNYCADGIEGIVRFTEDNQKYRIKIEPVKED